MARGAVEAIEDHLVQVTGRHVGLEDAVSQLVHLVRDVSARHEVNLGVRILCLEVVL